MGNYTILSMFENPRRGRQTRNFTTNAPKTLDLKSSSEQIFSPKLPLGASVFMRYHGLEKTPIPISKVKYGSYPSKNIPYFIHLLSLHVFHRIIGLALPISLESIHSRGA